MKRLILIACVIVGVAWSSRALFAFCGFYVAKADAKLFNSASQVVLARDGDRTGSVTLSCGRFRLNMNRPSSCSPSG